MSQVTRHRSWRARAGVGAALVLLPAALAAQSAEVDAATIAKIRDEAFNRSQVMNTMSYLTDVNGPRLTGSPITRRAADWTVQSMKSWGLSDPHLETWGPFGRGWVNDKFYAQVTAPVPFSMIGYAQAWTPGTNGLIKSEVVYLNLTEPGDTAKYVGKLAGKIVIATPMRDVAMSTNALGSRLTDDALDKMSGAPMPAPAAGRGAGAGGRGGPPMVTAADSAAARARQVAALRRTFPGSQGAAALIEPGRGDGGTVFTDNGDSRDPKNQAKVTRIVVAIEHYGRIFRAIEKGVPVQMELDVKNTYFDQDPNSFNIIAEIPGTDPKLKDEVVMMGAHFDSWQSATGATDNAAGSATMLEAMRILKTVGAKPKRTIRIGLWTGEEQGLLGSRAYVKEHFGVPDSIKPAAAKMSVYLNLDNGTGAVRGVYEQGNSGAAPVFTEWMKSFADKGMKTLTLSNTGGTDHLSFDAVGIPGFQFIQDPLEYGTRTHHSNMDTYERIQPADMQLNSAVLASFALNAANRTEMFPRKPAKPPVP